MMFECSITAPRDKQRKITLKKEPILQEIDRLSYKLSDSAIEDARKDKVATDTEDELDGAIINSFLEGREAVLRKRLTFCLIEEECVEIDNTNAMNSDFVFQFQLSKEFNDREMRTAVQLMHQYLVKGTLVDWYMHTGVDTGTLGIEVRDLENTIIGIFRRPYTVCSPRIAYMNSYKIR